MEFDHSAKAASPLLGLSQRLPPSNLEAECAILGAILSNNSAFHRVAAFLKPDHFASPENGRIYKECARRILGGEAVDAVSLKVAFEHTGILDEVGGTTYLASLLRAMVSLNTADVYAKTVHDAWVRRQLIDIHTAGINNAYGSNPELTGADQVKVAADHLIALVSDAHAKTHAAVSIGDAVSKRIKAGERVFQGGTPDGLMTGIASLDAKMGGFGDGELIYLMAIRNAGKTGLALQIAVNVAQRLLADWMGGGWEQDPTARLLGDPNKMVDPALSLSRCPGVLFDSYEMSAELLAGRVIAYLSGVKVRMLRDGKWETDTAFRLRQVELATKHLPLRILDRPGQSAASMAILGRMEARHRPIVLRITDNMRKVVGESMGERGNRNDTTQATSSKWKDDAKHWGRHIVLCHPRADAGRRDMGGLQLGDMPYGADNDADQVLGLDRPEMFVSPNPPPKPAGMKDETYANITKHHYERLSAVAGVAYVVSLKAREGATNWSVKLKWDGETTSFTDPSVVAPITSMDEDV